MLYLGCGNKASYRLPPPASNAATAVANHGSEGTKDAPRPPEPSATEALRTAPLDWEASPLMKGLGRLRSKMTSSAYVHGIDVDVRSGYYAFDCSGMVEWVLRDSAPVAYSGLRRGLAYRPLARDFVNFIGTVTTERKRTGWVRVARVADALPGDVIAWLKPKFIKSENTGHVAIIVQPPRLRSPYDTAYVLRVADSSRLRHEDDTRGGRGGFGFGTILVETNPATGSPTGFSFAGSFAEHAFGTKIVIGRPTK